MGRLGMDESTDVDRMLARLGETNLHYREFTDASTRPPRSWGEQVEPVQPLPPRLPEESVGPLPTGWNAGRTVHLSPEPLLVDPEAPGGRQAAIHLAQLRGGVTTDAIVEGRTPPAPLDRTPAPTPSPAAAPHVANPVQQHAPTVAATATGLDGLFRRVAGGEPPADSATTAAPLSSLFKRLS